MNTIWRRSFTPARTLLLGVWLTALFWPYAHSGGFVSPFLLSLFPMLLAAADLLPRWETKISAMAIAFALELVVEVQEPLSTLVQSLVAIPHVLITEAPAAWATLPPTAGLVLILLAVVLGWLVFRVAVTRDRVLLLLLLGGVILIINHTFWHLEGEGPLAAYLVVGLWLLADTHLEESAAAAVGRPTAYWYSVLGAALILPLLLGWATPGQPGHVSGKGGTLPLASGANGRGVGLSNGYVTGLGIGDTEINHPVTPSEQTVLAISGIHQPSYWQTAIYTQFNGTSWSAPVGTPTPFTSGGPAHLFFTPSVSGFSTESWNVTFAMAGHTGRVPLLYNGTPTDVVGASGTVLPGLEELVSSGVTTYHVTMAVPEINLAAVASVPFSAVPASLTPDLETPRNLSPKVKQLAETITAHATGPWQAAEDLARYLDKHEKYTFKFVPSSTGDAVNQFLLVTHAGYCDQFSTSFIMMARSVGIPARWVVGYGPGTYDIKTHDYIIKAIDAHSWAQVYVAPYGWIPIDPTFGWEIPSQVQPGRTITEMVKPSAPVKLPPIKKVVAKAKRHPPTRPSQQPLSPGQLPWTTIAVVAIGVLAVWLAWRNAQHRMADPRHRLSRLQRRLWLVFRLGTRHTVSETATLREMFLAMPPQHRSALKPAVLVVERWWYAGSMPDDSTVDAAEAGVNEVLRALLRGVWVKLQAG